MDQWPGKKHFFFVGTETIKKYNGVYHTYFSRDPWSWQVDVMHYAGSSGSLERAHPNLKYMLHNIGRYDLMQNKTVQVYDWGTLCRKYNVRSVDVVQLDCEGKGCAILRGMIRHWKKSWQLPRIIQFEANHLTPKAEIKHTVESLRTFGFRVRYWGDTNILVERSYS